VRPGSGLFPIIKNLSKMRTTILVQILCLFICQTGYAQYDNAQFHRSSVPCLDISSYLDLAYQMKIIKPGTFNPANPGELLEDVYSINNITVWPHNASFFGWNEEQVEKVPNGEPIDKPESPFVGIACFNASTFEGAFRISLPNTDYPELRRVRIRNDHYSGVYLRQITGLSYSTYIVNHINRTAPVLVLQIDSDNDGMRDCNIYYNPQMQSANNSMFDNIMDFPEVVSGEQQFWKASSGWWQFNQVTGGITPPAGLKEYFTLNDFISFFQNARTINTAIGTAAGGAIRITVGGDDPDYRDFNGYILNFYIATHPYAADFYKFKANCGLPANSPKASIASQ
jgi:hypothetical protein